RYGLASRSGEGRVDRGLGIPDDSENAEGRLPAEHRFFEDISWPIGHDVGAPSKAGADFAALGEGFVPAGADVRMIVDGRERPAWYAGQGGEASIEAGEPEAQAAFIRLSMG